MVFGRLRFFVKIRLILQQKITGTQNFYGPTQDIVCKIGRNSSDFSKTGSNIVPGYVFSIRVRSRENPWCICVFICADRDIEHVTEYSSQCQLSLRRLAGKPSFPPNVKTATPQRMVMMIMMG